MSESVCLGSELSAVMESLVIAAVAGLERLTDSEEVHTMFAPVMKTLCNEALGKILSILESVKVELKLDKCTNPPSKPQVLYILQNSRVGVEHSYGAIRKKSRGKPNTEQSDHCYGADISDEDLAQSEEEDSAGLELIPVSIKDKLGNINLEATAEGAEKCFGLSHTPGDQNLPKDYFLDSTAHSAFDTPSEENHTVTESGPSVLNHALDINSKMFDLTAIVKEIESSNKAMCRKNTHTAQDNLSYQGTEASAQTEDLLEESIFSVKSENENATVERLECDSMTFSPTSHTSPAASVPQGWRFNCDICEIGYDSQNVFSKHMCTHTKDKPFKCPSCDSSYHQSASLKRHMYKHTGERPFKCPECEKGFTDKDKLKGHMSVHTGQKAFPCMLCKKSFTAKTNLYRHMRLHTGVRPYTCSECGRSYTRQETLKDHMVTAHSSGIKPLKHTFKCSFCDRVFSQKANLMVHERIHTGERPYVCPLCSKAFRTSVSLKVHLRVHTGEKPYVCDVCSRPFSQQSSLLVHRRVHLNERSYVCPTCNKSFNNPQNLKVHVRVHTGERPFVCGLCGKTFVQDAHLRIHKQHMHTGVKQYVCEHCGKSYADRRSLRLHKCVYK